MASSGELDRHCAIHRSWESLAEPQLKAPLARGLFRGMSVNYLRAVPMTAVSFSVYETMKQAMGLSTGVRISG